MYKRQEEEVSTKTTISSFSLVIGFLIGCLLLAVRLSRRYDATTRLRRDHLSTTTSGTEQDRKTTTEERKAELQKTVEQNGQFLVSHSPLGGVGLYVPKDDDSPPVRWTHLGNQIGQHE